MRKVGWFLVVLMLLATVLPAAAASWEERINGGGSAVRSTANGDVYFQIALSAWEDGAGNAAGEIQFTRLEQPVPDFVTHADVQCIGVSGNLAVVAGPASNPVDSAGLLGSGQWLVVWVLDGGSDDDLNLKLTSAADAQAACDSPALPPGQIDLVGGNLNVKSK